MENASSDTEMGQFQSHTQRSQENKSQADSSFEEYQNQEPPSPIPVTADVHAEMNADDSDAENTDAHKCTIMSQSSTENPVVKKLLMATDEQKAYDDEIFSIDFDVPWRTAKQNLHRYRIKTENPFATGYKSSGASVMAAKISPSRRRIPSLIERPSTEIPMYTPSTRTFSNAGQPFADRTTNNRWLSTKNNGRKRKSNDEYVPLSSSDSDEDQEEKENDKESSPSDGNPTAYHAKKRNILSTMSPQPQVPETSSSLFDKLVLGPKFHMGSEIESSNSHIPLNTYGRDHSFKRNSLSGSDTDDS